jgi:hypothetical protein
MWGVSDGAVRAVFGVLVIDGWYEAHPGEAEFRAGRLVRLAIGDAHTWQDADGRPLTVGFTYFPHLAPDLSEYRRAADCWGYIQLVGRTRVYAGGELAEESDLGVVNVAIDHPAD